MSKEELKSRLESIFNKIFHNVPEETIHTLTKINTEGWDSLAHLNLVISLEEEFEVSITPEEATMITSFYSVLSILESKK